MGITLKKLVENVPPETESRIKFIKDTYNRPIRNILRRETGLRLNVEIDNDESLVQANISVPILILPGVPKGLEHVEFDVDQQLSLLLAPWRKPLEQFAKSGTAIMGELLPKLEPEILRGREHHFFPPIELVEELIEILNKIDLVETLFSQPDPENQIYLTDWLGAYWHKYSENSLQSRGEHVECWIELYWGVIGLCAQHLNVSVEGLALKVLAHELGHAYSHVGADIDGKRWPSRDFRQCSRHVKEGIAQYCAQWVLKDLYKKIPEGLHAFEKLVPKQPEPYQTHKRWSEYSSEEVRHALLAFRRNGSRDLDEFEISLVEAKSRLRGTSSAFKF